MPKCEHCNRDFDTDEGLAQHVRDKHGIGKVTAHDMKEMKKQERETQKAQDVRKQKSGKRVRTIAIIAVVVIVLAGIGYAVLNMPKTSTPIPSGNYNLDGFPNSFIHWHADVDVSVCGEDKSLPESAAGSLIGTSRMHTHDYAANIQSLPGSDGNGVIHTEGVVRVAPQEHTLEKFMKNIGIIFDNDSIMDKNNGDLCGETPGMVKVFLNEQPLDNFLNYLPRDRDMIRIEFS